ncbi:hypothetical protein ROA7450_04123 [Roseovarius albus]|uniref:Uncharacterized protein n=1 Tax=Roseovarius albus TaxID=1247867 RepID=A0A1X7A8Q7_9RHOB|nr:hypothetical protein ROA7450_04123 [Roseovarius albus]
MTKKPMPETIKVRDLQPHDSVCWLYKQNMQAFCK